MIIIAIVYLVLCVWISVIGSNRKFGFWGYFFCSLFLTPIIGSIVMLASDKQPENTDKCPKCDYPLAKRT